MVYWLLRRVLPHRLALLAAAAVYAGILILVFLLWDTQQAGFRYEEL